MGEVGEGIILMNRPRKMSDISSDIRHKTLIHSRWVGGCQNYSADSTWNEKCPQFLVKLDIRTLYIVGGWVSE